LVHRLVQRLGQIGLAALGGALLAASDVTLAFEPNAWLAPLAITSTASTCCTTLQTNARRYAGARFPRSLFSPRFISDRPRGSPPC
jgi:hypothetical protein